MTQPQPKQPQAVICLIDGAHGIYVPQYFSRHFDKAAWRVSETDRDILSAGPDHPEDWDTGVDVLDRAQLICAGNTWRLYQDGDLYAYCWELMTAEERANFGWED